MALTTPFSYNPQDPTDFNLVRQMIPDTVNTEASPAVYNDYEITNFFTIQQKVAQSSMFFSGPAFRNIPNQPPSLYRVVALAIDTIANNTAQLAMIVKLLDVELSTRDAARILAERAQEYRRMDDESGAFFVIEQCPTLWAYIQRYQNQIQRQTGGGGGN